MIIDVHTHLWPGNVITNFLIEYFKSRKIWDEKLSVVTAERLLEAMDAANVKISIVSSVALDKNMGNDDLDKINTYVSNEVQNAGSRLIGFCTVDPLGGEASLDILQKGIEVLGHKGLKLHPPFQQFYPNDRKVYPLYEKMQQYGLPVLFHTGSIGVIPFRDMYAYPTYIDDIACDFPKLPIILGHAGKIWHDEAVMLMRKHKNVYADFSTNLGRAEDFKALPLSWFLYKVKIWAGSFDRVLFGSDYPFYFQDETIESLNEARKYLNRENKNFITDEDIKKMTYLNAEKLISSFNK